MPSVQLANKGYFAAKKESTKGTAVTPDKYFPIYDETFMTEANLDEDNPIVGNKFMRFQAVQGQRTHAGEATFLAEPNTTGYLLDMILTKGTTTGSDPYTHPFNLSIATDPNSYTVDIAKGQVVHRFIGVEMSEMESDWDENKMLLKCKFSALKSFITREIDSVASNVVTFKTNYDPTPTAGLVVSDLVRIFDASAGTSQDFTISSLSDTAATLSGSPSGIVSGDLFSLRPATPSFTLKTPFLWARSEFRFGTDAATALSASQTRVEKDSKFKLIHKFEEDEGSMRSGAFDPASLNRTQGDVECTVKRFFDTPEDMNRFHTVTKNALVIRMYSETGYELRVTLNNLKMKENPTDMNTEEIIYSESTWVPTYDTSDAQGFDVKVINAVSSI